MALAFLNFVFMWISFTRSYFSILRSMFTEAIGNTSTSSQTNANAMFGECLGLSYYYGPVEEWMVAKKRSSHCYKRSLCPNHALSEHVIPDCLF